MRTVVLGPRPAELEAVIARRHALGLDLYDEVWDGDYHMAPAPHSAHGDLQIQVARLIGPLADLAGLAITAPFNLGRPDDYRVPDGGLHRGRPNAVWLPTAAMVIEVVSPDDETWQKLSFYAAHDVDEAVIVESATRRLIWLQLDRDAYVERASSRLLGPDSAGLADGIQWPGEQTT